MPRPRKATTAVLEDQEIPGLERLDQDPQPRATRGPGRPRKATTAGARGRIAARTPAGRVMSKAAMQSKVREEIEMYLSLTVAGWELRDPECAAEATPERIAVIADRLVAMISRSDSLLQTAASSGIFGDIILFLNAILPIGKAVWKAHGPGGMGHDRQEVDPSELTARYPAYAG